MLRYLKLCAINGRREKNAIPLRLHLCTKWNHLISSLHPNWKLWNWNAFWNPMPAFHPIVSAILRESQEKSAVKWPMFHTLLNEWTSGWNDVNVTIEIIRWMCDLGSGSFYSTLFLSLHTSCVAIFALASAKFKYFFEREKQQRSSYATQNANILHVKQLSLCNLLFSLVFIWIFVEKNPF